MRYLLDTNVLVFMLCAPQELSAEAKRVVQNERHLFASIASFWEIAIKQKLGKLSIRLGIPEMEAVCRGRGIDILPIGATAIERTKTLPDIHRDPFDRLLVAQALDEGLAIVTRDKAIPRYPVQAVW